MSRMTTQYPERVYSTVEERPQRGLLEREGVRRGSVRAQVMHPVLFGFDMAVEHGAVGLQAELVRGARDFEPLIAVDLVVTNDAAHALMEDLGAAAGQRIDAGIHQFFERRTDGQLAALGEVGNLYHGESLQVHFGKALFQAAQHLAVPIERQFGVQAADDVEFGDRF